MTNLLLSPTLKRIQIENEAIETLTKYRDEIKSLCDDIEKFRDNKSQYVANELSQFAQKFKVDKEYCERLEFPFSGTVQNFDSITAQIQPKLDAGSRILERYSVGNTHVIYLALPGANEKAAKAKYKALAEQEADKRVEESTKKRNAKRCEAIAYKKEIEARLVTIESFDELLKSIN